MSNELILCYQKLCITNYSQSTMISLTIYILSIFIVEYIKFIIRFNKTSNR